MELYQQKIDDLEDDVEELGYKVDTNTEYLVELNDKIDDYTANRASSSLTSSTNTNTLDSIANEQGYSEEGIIIPGILIAYNKY